MKKEHTIFLMFFFACHILNAQPVIYQNQVFEGSDFTEIILTEAHSGSRFVNCTFRNITLSGEAVINVDGAQDVVIERCTFENIRGGGGHGVVLQNGAGEITLDGNRFHHNVNAVSVLSADNKVVRDVRIINNWMYKNNGYAITIEKISNARVFNNTFVDNEEGHLQIEDSNIEALYFANNLFVSADIFTLQQDKAHSQKYKVKIVNDPDDDDKPVLNTGRLTSDLSGDLFIDDISKVKFVDFQHDDYHLTPTSPAVDAGVSPTIVSTDIDREPRPAGRRYDVGGDELMSASTTSLPWEEQFNDGQNFKGSVETDQMYSYGSLQVVKGKMTARGVGQAAWTSDVIALGGTSVDMSLVLSSEGELEATNSYDAVQVYVKVDGGSEQLVKEKKGNISGYYQFVKRGITGTSLQIIVHFLISDYQELYFLDGVQVKPAGTNARQAIPEKTEKVTDELLTSGWSMYPNPAQHQVEVVRGNGPLAQVHLLTVWGEVMRVPMYRSSESAVRLDLQHLSPGMYVLQAFTQDGKRYTQSLIKQ